MMADTKVKKWAFVVRSEDFTQSIKTIQETLANKLGWCTRRQGDCDVDMIKEQINAKQKDRDYKLFFYFGHGSVKEEKVGKKLQVTEFDGLLIDDEVYKPGDVPAKRNYSFVFLCCCGSYKEPAASKFWAAFNTNKNKKMAYLGFTDKISETYAYGWATNLFKSFDGGNTLSKYIVENEYEDPNMRNAKPKVIGNKFIKIDGK